MATVTQYTYWFTPAGHKCVAAGITPSSNFTLGGESLEAANFSMNGIIAIVGASMANGYPLQWDNVAGKIKLYALSNGASLNGAAMIASQGGVNCTGMIYPVIVIGTPQ